jgi:hypothetical protein
LIVVLLGSLQRPIFGQDDTAEQPCDDYEVECADDTHIGRLQDYYKSHSRVRLGQEHRLSNGVAWRNLVDIPTKLAIPRITWMPDRKAMQGANRLLDAIHGGLLLRYAELKLSWRETGELAAKAEGSVPAVIPRDRFIWQPDLVSLSFATSKLVSYAEVRIYRDDGMLLPEAQGRVLDLERGRIFSIESCTLGESYYGNTFRFGDFLEVCDPESLTKFLALWAERVGAASKAAVHGTDPYAEYCAEAMKPYGSGRWLALYLTPSGLAVHNGRFWPNSAYDCMLEKSAVNPVIIPYRELEPFMKPGPWRDELLGKKP